MPDKIYRNYMATAMIVIWTMILAAKFAPSGTDWTIGIVIYVVSFLATASIAVIKYIDENTIKRSLDLSLLFAFTSSTPAIWMLGYLYEQSVGPFFK
jgi:phosphoglycerol transferase MdoB-like AlkP superfamily enzyme